MPAADAVNAGTAVAKDDASIARLTIPAPIFFEYILKDPSFHLVVLRNG